MANKPPTTVGLIGYGSAGRYFHAPLIAACPQLLLSKIMSSRSQLDDEIKHRYPQARRVTEAEAILADPDIDLVVIASPNSTHFTYAQRALQANKHVVVDKPFTVTSQEADRLIAAANQAGRVLSVFQNRRWDSDFLTVQEILANNLLGQVVQFSSCFNRFRPQIKTGWREEATPGSGVLYDLGSHLLDQALSLFGTPSHLYAHLARQRPAAPTIDYFKLHLYYPKLLVELSAGQLASAPSSRFTVLGRQGGYQIWGLDGQEEQLKSGLSASESTFGQAVTSGTLYTEEHPNGRPYPSRPGAYITYYPNVAAAISSGAPLLVTAEQSRNVVYLLELAHQSHRRRCALPVEG